ncbi:MAG: tryptophan synthase subunit alpha, partial [Candidatus Bathyarchaeia archaeon]
AEEYRRVSLRNGVDTIFLATPSTPIPRLKRILSFTTGFLYLVSLFGVTGARKSLAQITTQTVEKFHHHTAGAAPMAVGFGISKPSHVRAIIKHGAEGAIIGSAFVKVVEKNLNKPSEISPQIQAFAEKLKAATLRY